MKLSIITVNLNNAEGLRKTIESIVNQTYTNFEHIIIDGGSTDGSVDVIKEYEALYKKKKHHLYWVSEPDKGIYNAMNKGIKKAKGEYCLFLNSGDVLYAEHTLNQVQNILTQNNHGFIYGDIVYKYSADDLKYVISTVKISLSLFEKGSLPHPSTFIKRDLFNQYGLYNENLKVVSDYEFFLKVFINSPKDFHYINIPISVFEMNGISCDPKFKQVRDKEREEIKLKYLPSVVWQELNNYNLLTNKYNGLLSSGSIKLVLNIRKALNRIR